MPNSRVNRNNKKITRDKQTNKAKTNKTNNCLTGWTNPFVTSATYTGLSPCLCHKKHFKIDHCPLSGRCPRRVRGWWGRGGRRTKPTKSCLGSLRFILILPFLVNIALGSLRFILHTPILDEHSQNHIAATCTVSHVFLLLFSTLLCVYVQFINLFVLPGRGQSC